MIYQLKHNPIDDVYDGFIVLETANGRLKRHVGQYFTADSVGRDGREAEMNRFVHEAQEKRAQLLSARYSQNGGQSDGSV